METKPARTRIRPLQLQHLVQQGQTQRIVGMVRRPGALVLQTGKAIAFKGLENPRDMRPREREAVRDTRLLPAFCRHADHRPAGVVGITKAILQKKDPMLS